MSILPFSKPDERTRQLRERAGATAAMVMSFAIAYIGCIFMFGYKDMKTGELLMCPIFLIGFYSLARGGRLRLMVRDEYTRKADMRKKGLKALLWFIPLTIVIYFCFYLLFPTNHPKSLRENIFQAAGLGIWMGVFYYWMYFRKVKKKENENHE